MSVAFASSHYPRTAEGIGPSLPPTERMVGTVPQPVGGICVHAKLRRGRTYGRKAVRPTLVGGNRFTEHEFEGLWRSSKIRPRRHVPADRRGLGSSPL